jgi:uncharacterized membrane protein YjjP (DUF1212 family)
MDSAEFRTKTRFIIKLGRALHQCGTSSQRIERHLINVARMLGLNGNFLITPTTFTCAFWVTDELDQFIHIERVEPAEQNLGRLWEIDRLVEGIAEKRISFEEGVGQLEQVTSAPLNYPPAANAVSWALSGGSFACLLSANPRDGLAATILSLLLYFISHLGSRHAGWKPLVTILVPFVAGILASSANASGLGINVPFVVLSSIIIFIPGLALTVALTEISTGHLISGSSRLVDAMMQLLKLFFGAVSGVAVAEIMLGGDRSAATAFTALPDWRIWPAVIGLSLGLGIAFNIPPRKMGWGLLSAIIAFGAASIGGTSFGMYAGMFIGALTVGLFSNLYSRVTRGPGSILMTQGIVLLVPGSRTYMILNHWVSGEDILPGTSGGNQAVMVFLSLIVGLLFANALLPTRKTL